MTKIVGVARLSSMLFSAVVVAGALHASSADAAQCAKTYTIGYSQPVSEALAVQAVAKSTPKSGLTKLAA